MKEVEMEVQMYDYNEVLRLVAEKNEDRDCNSKN